MSSKARGVASLALSMASSPSMEPQRLVVHLTVAELDERVEQAVARALAAVHSPEPEYRSRHEEAARLGVSLTKLDRLVLKGLPFVRVGDTRRFRSAEVDAWLRASNSVEAAE